MNEVISIWHLNNHTVTCGCGSITSTRIVMNHGNNDIDNHIIWRCWNCADDLGEYNVYIDLDWPDGRYANRIEILHMETACSLLPSELDLPSSIKDTIHDHITLKKL